MKQNIIHHHIQNMEEHSKEEQSKYIELKQAVQSVPKKKVVLSICILLILIEFSVVAHSVTNYLQSQDLQKGSNNTKFDNSSAVEDDDHNLSPGITEDEPSETFLSLWLNKILGMVVCIKCNVLVIYGIRKNSPNFLIPWLAVYLLGIFSLMVGGLIVLSTQLTLTFVSHAPFIPIFTGVIFFILWWQVKDVFWSLRMQRLRREAEENGLEIGSIEDETKIVRVEEEVDGL